MPELPEIPTSLTQVFFAVESRLSPRLERAVRTDAFLDTAAVANGVSRVAGRTIRGIANGVTEALGLPSRRQVEGLQRSLDELNQKEKS
ncbi:hypothetical protein [Antrihabitans stalactiti]|uniref:Uncharacterized protein n=1 Tax=Antrihabitans stalactiti TaxID=2584121 RepID=A0A848KKM0_9NOCA|nr:hypothetical protein [Antrihabitans stalactiti]NMN98406.1 hypothetical protein [Antrihabitans stalactiti]